MTERAARQVALGCAIAGTLFTLWIMWNVTDFAHSSEDVAVGFYALLAISPYVVPYRWYTCSLASYGHAVVAALTAVMVTLVGLYAYHHAFYAQANDHNGFMFFFVPALQWVAFWSVHQLLTTNELQH